MASESMLEQQHKKADSPPKTPGSKSSSRSKASKTSATSKLSNASSVAYFLRNRSDMRLFHKKSMPIAHTKKRPRKPTRLTMPLRSPSYYKPKVVSDTLESSEHPATPLTASEFIKVAGPSTLTLQAPSPRFDPPAITTKPIQQVHSSAHTHSSPSTPLPLHATPPQIQPLSKRTTWGGKQVNTNETSLSSSRPSTLRFMPTKRPALEARESSKPSTVRPKHISLPGPVSVATEALPERKHYHNITPPEADPTSPFQAPLRHGDHYFRTFGNDTVYMKSFTPTMIPTTPQKQSSGSSTPLALPPSARRDPSENNTSDQRKRKRSSIFNMFRRTAVNDGVIKGPRSDKKGTRRPQSPPTPSISISPPFESVKRRRSELTSSEMSLPPYFARPARSPSSSLATPSPSPISPMTVTGSPEPRRAFAARRSWSQRSSGDSPVSPGTQPRLRRPRLRHQATLADITDADADMPAVTAHGDVASVVPPKSGAGLQSKIKSPKSEADLQATPRGSGAVQWQSTAEKNVPTTPPVEHLGANTQDKSHSTFKQFFRDLHLSTSAGKLDMDAESPRAPTVGRRISLLPRSSMATLLARGSKPSLDKLKLKPSQGTISPPKRTERWERPELRVTDFYQTPYSQRVANNRRAELTHINALVEEALNDDEEDDTIMGFELNVPDHLPSSPLCPLNPKHKSGGKAICPLHGRKKKIRTAAGTRSRASVAPRLGPRIVYEGAVGRTESGQSVVRIQEPGDGGKSPERLGSSHEAWYMS
ncbi:hypothetical protein LTR27_012641 [Elasticomyces elasticus]|nr:hypothetical protein LTR27_012641 [Elasticomyces elasticus]